MELRIALLVGIAWLVAFSEENVAQIRVFADRPGIAWLRGTSRNRRPRIAETS